MARKKNESKKDSVELVDGIADKSKSVRVNPDGFDIKNFDKLEICEEFDFSADSLVRITIGEMQQVIVLATINGVKVALVDYSEEFQNLIKHFS